ncbi:hypothetical protein C8Q75DRAFT_762041 [Abortiporus biennis]|nr:hypothetical protein C8Q75DRAFT_762041 [Abortiporus biennis]
MGVETSRSKKLQMRYLRGAQWASISFIWWYWSRYPTNPFPGYRVTTISLYPSLHALKFSSSLGAMIVSVRIQLQRSDTMSYRVFSWSHRIGLTSNSVYILIFSTRS